MLGFVFWVTYVGIMMLQSLLNAMGMEFVNRGYPVNYGRCRGIGALLCAFAIWGIGRLEESTVEVSLLVFSVGLFLIAVTASCFRMPPRREAIREVEAAPKKALLSLFRKYPFFLLFSIGVMLNQASYNISGIYLIHVGDPLGRGQCGSWSRNGLVRLRGIFDHEFLFAHCQTLSHDVFTASFLSDFALETH